jgi:NADH:ubiquinone oxidoreductase subunit C
MSDQLLGGTDAIGQSPLPRIFDPAAILIGVGAPIPSSSLGKHVFQVERSNIIEACARLRAEGCEHLTLITAIDWKKSWEVVYHLTRIGQKEQIVLRVTLPRQDPRIPSITTVWPGAGWHERETYDLMGIVFTGNLDLRRILLPHDFEGHPLRKEVKYGNTS